MKSVRGEKGGKGRRENALRVGHQRRNVGHPSSSTTHTVHHALHHRVLRGGRGQQGYSVEREQEKGHARSSTARDRRSASSTEPCSCCARSTRKEGEERWVWWEGREINQLELVGKRGGLTTYMAGFCIIEARSGIPPPIPGKPGLSRGEQISIHREKRREKGQRTFQHPLHQPQASHSSKPRTTHRLHQPRAPEDATSPSQGSSSSSRCSGPTRGPSRTHRRRPRTLRWRRGRGRDGSRPWRRRGRS